MSRTPFDNDPFVREAVEELFAPRVRDGVAPGSIVAVFGPDGAIEYARGFGVDRPASAIRTDAHAGAYSDDRAGAVPDLDTAFRIASCSKSFTAAAALLLRDRGALGLDQPITDFVPEFHFIGANAGSGAGQVPTLRQLLSMSGGLPTDDPWADRQESLSDEAFRAIIAAGTPRDSIPGTRFEYSNYGFALIGRAIARASGRPFIEFVTAELLEPLGLTATGYTATGRPDRVAPGWRRDHEGGLHEQPFSGPGAFSPIGGVVTTARELARWAAWLASALDGDAAARPGPLSPASRRELQQVQRTIPFPRAGVHESGYGFGLFVEKGPDSGHTVSHSGGYPGFSAHMRWNAPAGFGVVAFENQSYAGVSVPVTALVDALVRHLGPGEAQGEGAAPRMPHPAPWPATVELARAADRLIDLWLAEDDEADASAEALAAEILSANVALDVPYAERRAIVRGLGLLPSGGRLAPDEEGGLEASVSPARVSWRRRADAGHVRVQLLATPTVPTKIQALRISRE